MNQPNSKTSESVKLDKYTLGPDCDSGCLDQGIRVCEHMNTPHLNSDETYRQWPGSIRPPQPKPEHALTQIQVADQIRAIDISHNDQDHDYNTGPVYCSVHSKSEAVLIGNAARYKAQAEALSDACEAAYTNLQSLYSSDHFVIRKLTAALANWKEASKSDKGEECVYCGKDSWTCEHSKQDGFGSGHPDATGDQESNAERNA